MIDIRTFSKRFMLWTAIIVAVIIAAHGLLLGKVGEGWGSDIGGGDREVGCQGASRYRHF